MAGYPEFNVATMPSRILPMENEQEATQVFLGGKVLPGERRVKLRFIANDGQTSARMQALYTFWRDDCDYGATPFLMSLPLFGAAMDDAAPQYLLRWTGPISATYENNSWKLDHTFRILGEVQYVVDDTGDYVVDDTGALVITDPGLRTITTI